MIRKIFTHTIYPSGVNLVQTTQALSNTKLKVQEKKNRKFVWKNKMKRKEKKREERKMKKKKRKKTYFYLF